MRMVLSCLLMWLCTGLFAQDIDKNISTIRTSSGYILVYNFENCKFSLEIGSDKMNYENGQYEFDVNKRILQVTTEEITNVPLLNSCKSLMDSLIIHRNHMLKVFESTVDLQFEIPNREMLRLKTGDFLFWYFNNPEGLNSELEKHYYLTCCIGDRFLILKTTTDKDVNVNVIKDYLTKYALTLKKYDRNSEIENLIRDKSIK